MPHLTFKEIEAAHKEAIPQESDIVVVGAGMSGLYVTWRILQENRDRRILIIDRLDRTGGRLDSDLIRFDDGETVKEEEGGMRFTFNTMDNLMALFLLLKDDSGHSIAEQIVPFPMSSGGNNRLYFRGHSFTNKDANVNNYDIWTDLYNLDAAEQGINPKTIIDTVFNRILDVNPDFKERPDNRTPEFWQKFRLECKWKGVLLKDWSLWDLFMEMGYSNECVTLLYRLLGFNGTFLSQMNAGEAYQLLEDFPSEPDFKTLEDGFSTLPNALVEEIGKDKIFLRTNLESIQELEDESKRAEGYQYSLEYTDYGTDGTPKQGTVLAKKVILGLPRLALEKLFVKSNALNKLGNSNANKLWDTLQTTTNQPLLKINLYYDKAWWGNNISGQPPVSFGPNFSDLPLGSVYPFYSIGEELFAALEYQKWLGDRGKEVPKHLQGKIETINDSKYAKPAALTIYCDYLNINFWKALQHTGDLFSSPMQEKYKDTLFPASQAIVREATKFFKALFNTHYVPQPVLTSARIWSGSTRFDETPGELFGYGVHQWALHAQDDRVMADLVEPLDNLYTCGEAYSDYQGWVEGALRSANLVLAKGFNLKPISEVYQHEHDKSPTEAIEETYWKRSIDLIRKYIEPKFDPNASDTDIARDYLDAAKQELFRLGLTYFDRK